MKLTVLLIFLGVFSVHASSNAQKVTISGKGLSLQKVFSAVERQTGYTVLANKKDLAGAKPVSVALNEISLTELLDEVLKDQSLGYMIKGKTIFLFAKANKDAPTRMEIIEELPAPPIRIQVVDTTGRPLSGATVSLGNKVMGVTDGGGVFELDVNEGNMLQVSFVGYETHQVKVTKAMASSGNPLIITLQPQVSSLDEASITVNTGYQTITREKATGSYTTLGSKSLESRFAPNFINNLEGRVAGLVNYDGQMTVRGSGTLKAISSPLLVIDGLPVETAFEDINPYDIETVTVLKDAAAAAIYGARASNGVIVVTTKRASSVNKTEVEVSSNMMVWQKRNVDYADNWYMTPEQQVNLENDYYKWYFNDAPNATLNFSNVTKAINGTGSYNLNISPIMHDHYLLKNGDITEAELEKRMEKYSRNNFAREYAEHILKNQVINSHNIAVRNRTKNHQSNLILNFRGNNQGNIHDSDKQLNIFYKGSYDMNKWMTVNFSVNNILQRSVERRSNRVENIFDPFKLPAYYSMFNEDGSFANTPPGAGYYYNSYASWAEDNPALQSMQYHLLDEIQRNMHRIDRQNSRYHGDVHFKLAQGLTLNTQFIYEVNRETSSNYSEEDSYLVRLMKNVYTQNTGGTYRYLLPTSGGRLATEHRRGDHWTGRAQLNFSRTIADYHEIDFLAGVEFRETKRLGNRSLYLGWDDQLQSHATSSVNFNEMWAINTTGFLALGYPARSNIFNQFIDSALTSRGLEEIRRRNGSGYANLTYSFNRKYNAFVSLRKDYADVYGLATEFRGAPFGSFGASWNIHKEDFMSAFDKVNNLKLRASYGYTGNIYQDATSYMTATTGLTNTYTGQPRATIESPGNPELSWERTRTVNIGLEFMAFDSRFRGMIDLYSKNSDKVFSARTLESTTGFASLVMNMAGVKNNGLEVTLGYDWLRPKSRNGFAWTTSATAAWNKNKVTRVEIQAKSAWELIDLGYKEGYPVRSLFSYRFAGLTDQGAQSWYAEDGRIIPNVVIQNNTPGSAYFTGQLDPKRNFGMENQVAWKGFRFNMMMVYYGGHHMRANQIQIEPEPYSSPVRLWYLDAWTPNNKNTIVPGMWQYNTIGNTQPAVQNNTDIFVRPADFLKIRNIVLGYDLNRELVSRIGLTGASVRFQIDNLPAIWKSNDIGVDPETLGFRFPTCYVFALNFKF